MTMNLKTWNGFNINDVTNYESIIPEDAPLLPQAKANSLERSETWPLFAGKDLKGINLPIVIAIRGGSLEALKAAFNTEQQELYQLVANDGSEDYYLEGTPVTVVAEGAMAITVILFVPEPVWRSSTLYSSTWDITASGQTKVVANGSLIDILPSFEITPTGAKSGGSGYRCFIPIYNPGNEAFVNYPVNLTDNGTGSGVLNTAALVTAGKMQADGGDLRIRLNGKPLDRWLDGINTTSTRVWANITLKPGISFTLSGSMTNVETITQISVKKTTENIEALEKLPKKGILLIANEVFTYTGVDPKELLISGVERAEKDTAAAAHSDGDTIRWIEHDVWMLYGNTAMWNPTVDDTLKPIINLATSTNLSWDYDNFEDAESKLSGEWRGEIERTKGGLSDIYTGSRGAIADPSTEMGMSILAYYKSQKWKMEDAILSWRIDHPAGITSISSNGEKRRVSTDWPTVTLQTKHYKRDGKWLIAFTEPTPSSAATWQTWSHASVAISPATKSVKFVLDGSVSGSVANNQADFSVMAVTLGLDSTGIPVVKLNAENGNYHLDARLKNNTSGEWIDLDWTMKLNKKLTVNCEERTVRYANAVNALAARKLSTVRNDWLNLSPGNNTLLFTDTGTTAVTILIKYRKRATL